MTTLAGLSLGCYVLSLGSLGVPLALPFLIFWTLLFLAFAPFYLHIIARNTLIYAFPVLAVASAMWSDNPMNSFKLGLELTLTTTLGLVVAKSLSKGALVTALLIGLLFANGLALALGGREVIYFNNDVALNGLFGSKNSFAFYSSFLLLTSTAVSLSQRISQPVRWLSYAGLLLGGALVFATRSLGAIVSVTLGMALILGVRGFALLPARIRGQATGVGLVLGAIVGLALVAFITTQSGELLRLAGKSSDLTGRGKLWSVAEVLIADRPVLGVGYQSFWLRDNVWAEGLWRISSLPGRFGFHFHNLYYELVVELGFVGLAVFGTIFVVVFVKLLTRLHAAQDMPSALLLSMFIVLIARANTEVDFIAPFSLGQFLLAVFYCSENADASVVSPSPGRREWAPSLGRSWDGSNKRLLE